MRAGIVILVLSILVLAPALSVSAQGDIPAVPREATVIFENIEGRVPVPDNMNPYIAGQYLDWGNVAGDAGSALLSQLRNGGIDALAGVGVFLQR